jgi:hypothetical protein
MGVIRNVLLVLVTVLLFLSFFSSVLFLVLSSSLTYNNVQNQSVSIIHSFLQSSFNITSVVAQNYPFIQMYCQNHDSYIFSAQNYTFNIPCNVSLKGQEAIIDEGIREVVNQIYYKDYGCNFFDCFKQAKIPVFLISEMSRNFFLNLFFLSLGVSLLLLALAFFFIEKKTSLPILSGSVLIIASLPFMKIGNLVNFLSDKIYFQFIKIFFSESRNISIIFLIIGGTLLVFGVLLKIFKMGFSISEWISKLKKKSDGKEESQKEDSAKKTGNSSGKTKSK